MSFRLLTTKVFAFFILIFATSLATAAQDSIFELAAGTTFRVAMENEISSGVSNVGDTFTTKLTDPFKVRETVVVPVGTIIEGRVTAVKRAGNGGKGGMIAVTFETMRFATGETRKISGVLVRELKSESSKKTGLIAIVGGTLLGAVIGGVSKSANGAIIGAGIGAGTGAGIAVAVKGKDVRIRDNESFEIRLTKEVTLPVTDY